MPYKVPIAHAQKLFPNFKFVHPLTPSEQKAAFHVRDEMGTDLCLKLVSPDYDLQRLNREIGALQKLSHPNIVKLVEYTFTVKDGVTHHYVIEEFVEGCDLQDMLTPGQAWNGKQTKAIFTPILAGLEEFRLHGIVHRDLKPSNIRVRTNNQPVIIDFGMVRHLTLPDLTKTSEGARVGTPLYFAPEQASVASNKYYIDHRTDLFAVGVMIYQARVGSHPFFMNGMKAEQLYDAICSSSDFVSNAQFVALPARWQLFLKKLLAKQREHRFNSAALASRFISELEG